jgi:hypothetical protein
MSALWTGTPISVRLDDLDVICSVLDCAPAELLVPEPDKVAERRPRQVAEPAAGPSPDDRPKPKLGRNRSAPPV